MGRHSSGKNNYALSGGAIFALVVVALLVAGSVWFAASRGGGGSDADGTQAEEKPCVLGELALPVAAQDAAVAQELIGTYAASKPVVREYCVLPVLVDGLEEAAVYIAPATSVTQQELAAAGRTAAVSEPATVWADQVGLAGKAEADGAVLGNVRFPTDTPAVSAVAAFALADGPNAAVEALTDQRIGSAGSFEGAEGVWLAASASKSPQGLTFTPLDASVEYAAIPLNASDAVDENQARAGQDFARSASEGFESDLPAQPQVPELVWAAAMPAGGAAITGGNTDVAAQNGVRDTLFVLDTSDAMAPYMGAAGQAIGDAARGVVSQGKLVALWNYSSPLSEGVTKGYRRNVALTPNADELAAVTGRFITGGQPQTREAMRAAVENLAAGSADAVPTRIVLITTGTADGGAAGAGDDAFVEEFRQAAQGRVDVAVVHIGDLPVDPAMQQLAETVQQVDNADSLPEAVREAAGL